MRQLKKKVQHYDLRISIYSTIYGILVFLIVLFLTLGLNYGEATIVIPVADMSFLVAIALAAMLRREYLTWTKRTAILTATDAIVFLSFA